jgi:hypothetical protein
MAHINPYTSKWFEIAASNAYLLRLSSQLQLVLSCGNEVFASLIVHIDVYMQFPEGDSVAKAPPASKEVVAKLPVITITDDILAKLGPDAECAICKENLLVNDKMQEMPCKHTFHPPCLKPWLVISCYLIVFLSLSCDSKIYTTIFFAGGSHDPPDPPYLRPC